MLTIYTNKDFLERVLIDKTPKNWYNIFMSGNVAEVRVPEELDSDEIDEMGTVNIIGNLQLLGTTVSADADYINAIPSNCRSVLQNPNAIFLLDIEAKKAEDIQKQYGVICQSIDAINDDVLSKAYEYNLTDGREGVDWGVYFDGSNHTLPSNSLIICDRYIFSADARSDAKSAQYALELGLANIRGIMNSILPKKHNDEYNVLIVFDSSTLNKNEAQEDKMFDAIVKNLKEFADGYKRSGHYKIRLDIISVDHNCVNYRELHNRRIISNYFVVRAEYKLQAFNENISTATQTISYDALFSKIVQMKPNGPDSPIKSKLQTISFLQELICNGNCRKYASIVDRQEIDITKNCKPCLNRLMTNNIYNSNNL